MLNLVYLLYNYIVSFRNNEDDGNAGDIADDKNIERAGRTRGP